mgnify:CR=1 FL=1|tara:strand:+ start:573 stop:752 length:180 start_codon:yes stop_codon:yes gene_type:complete
MTDDRNIFMVWKVSIPNKVRFFIYYGAKLIEDVFQVKDVFLTAEVVGEFYPFIKRFYVI